MVLSRLTLAALALALSAGCLKRAPIPSLPRATSITVAYVMDSNHQRQSSDVPDALKVAVAEHLAKRNLQVNELPFETLAPTFTAVRESARRFQALEKASPNAKLRLLVEVRPEFYTQIAGRFRWTVYWRSTASVAGDEVDPVSEEGSFAATMMFEHLKHEAAVTEVSASIAERSAQLLDGLIAVPGELSSAPKGDSVYFVLVDRFENGDPSNDGEIDPKDPQAFHGGDLQGVLNRLDYLHALGVRTVWLSPVFQMRTEKFFEHGAFHGYWVEDFNAIEPRFGDEALLRKLSDELHARGMRLVLDVVLNHVAPGAPLTKTKPGWFHNKGPLTDWNDPVQLVSHDVHGLPDLNTDKEEVYRYLLDASVKWIREVRPDGFRLDAVKHLPLSFWARYNEDIRRVAGEDFVLLGEMLDGDATKVAKTQKEGKFGQMFDFPLAFALVETFCLGGGPENLGALLSNDRLHDAPGSLVTLLDNHDLPRVMSLCGGNVDRVKQALAVQLTARGTPAVTYGTEVGLEGEKEPENRADMRFEPSHPLHAWTSKLLELRRGSEALEHGVTVLQKPEPGLFSYLRAVDGEAVLIAINQSTESREVKGPSAKGRDLLSGEAVGQSVQVAPYSVRLVQFTPAESGGFAKLVEEARALWKGEAPRRALKVMPDGASLKEGETLRLVGGAPELGAWDPLKAPKASETVRLPVGGIYALKLVAVGEGGETRWQSGPNQLLYVPPGNDPIPVSATWD